MSTEAEPILERSVSRRTLLKAGAVAGAASLTSLTAANRALARALIPRQTVELVIPGYGGPADDAVVKYINPPFEKLTGVKVTIVQGPDTAKLQQMIKSNNVEWDLWPTGADLLPSIWQDPNPSFVPIDYKNSKYAASIPKQYKFKYLNGVDGYSMGIVWRKDEFPNGGPQSWVDVWNVDKFPGPRALPRRTADLVDIAVMAQGVPANSPDFYPVNQSKAIAKIKEIKPHTAKFWTGGEEPMQLLLSGEAVVAGVWLSRVVDPVKQGAPIQFTWKQNVFRTGGYAIVKGGKHIHEAQLYDDFVCRPDIQGVKSSHSAVAYLNPKAAAYVKPKSRLNGLPTGPANAPVLHASSGKFWVANEAKYDKLITDAVGV